jgi:hypothetical protein
MKLVFFLFGAFCFLSTTKAAKWANGYQAVLFYYAYQMDFLTNGADRRMAIGCVGRGHDGLCTLDEFLYYTVLEGHSAMYNTGEFDTTTPDLEKTASRLNTREDFLGVFDANALHASLGASANFVPIMEGITDIIQACRVAKGAALDTQLKIVRLAMSAVQSHRIAEFSDFLISDIKAEKTLQDLKVVSKPVSLEDGRTYNVLSIDGTIDSSGLDAPGNPLRNAFSVFMAGYGKSDTVSKKAARHMVVLDTIDQMRDRIANENPCA